MAKFILPLLNANIVCDHDAFIKTKTLALDWAFDLAVKPLVAIPATHSGTCVFEPWLYSLILAPTSKHIGRPHAVDQVIESLQPT